MHFNGLLNPSSYLTRTSNASGNNNVLTFSAWVKRSKINGDHFLFSEASSSHSSNPYISYAAFTNSDNLKAYSIVASGTVNHNVTSSAVFRDMSSFYHVVYVYDTSNADTAQRVKIYVNGGLLAAGTYTMGNTTTVFNTGNGQIIGDEAVRFRYGFPGYMANIHFVDGQALGPEYFAKTDTTSGSWIPKEFDGTSSTGGANANGANPSNAAGYDTLYGINGFHLDFRASSLVFDGSTLSSVNDVSGRTTPNNWTAS